MDEKHKKKSDTSKQIAWRFFDQIVANALVEDAHTNPWTRDSSGELRYGPDFATLALLLGVPLHLGAITQSGVPALALDVWLSYELRRAGFDQDAVWPRPTHPRVLPTPVAKLLKSLPSKTRGPLNNYLTDNPSISNVTSSSAKILGKNYIKQVDVVMTDWFTGPELLISTKRMDSSYGKNAPNRVEESYGDAKNLRLRHPLAALGFVFGLRSDILQVAPDTAEWLMDLLSKLGREDDAYHATCLVLMKYEENHQAADPRGCVSGNEIGKVIQNGLPNVRILEDKTPENLAPGRFLAAMVEHVLAATPVTMHAEARQRRKDAMQAE